MTDQIPPAEPSQPAANERGVQLRDAIGSLIGTAIATKRLPSIKAVIGLLLAGAVAGGGTVGTAIVQMGEALPTHPDNLPDCAPVSAGLLTNQVSAAQAVLSIMHQQRILDRREAWQAGEAEGVNQGISEGIMRVHELVRKLPDDLRTPTVRRKIEEQFIGLMPEEWAP